MTTSQERIRILAGGSLDVDNFGDLLFLLVTEKYLDGTVVATGPFGWDMMSILGRRVHAYTPLLEQEAFDVVWTMGGEMGGGASLEGAFRISSPDDLYAAFIAGSPEVRAAMIEHAMGGESMPHIMHPYIPPHLSYPSTESAVSVLNSVGLANFVDDLPDPGEGVRYLRSLTHVSVRDQESSDKLASLGIAHRLAPDAVHSLRLNRPATRPERPEIALFQVCESVLRRYGIDAVAAALIGCDALRQHPIRVLMTGTWREGGDSVDANRDLVRRVKGLDPAADIEMIMDRQPFDLVDHIQRARVVIGTSLHLRIVASAYDVPRVTLSVFVSDKPTRYARLWDDIMPFDVSLDEMGDAVNAALSLDSSRRVIAQSDELARLSDENLRQVSDQVISAARDRRRSATRL